MNFERIHASEVLVLVIAALLPIVWAPIFVAEAAPRVALALALAPVGVVALVRSSLDGDRASCAGMTVCAVAIISSLVSPKPANAALGSLDFWTGTVGLGVAIAWWACGRSLSLRATRLVLPALTVGAVWNSLLACLQVGLQIETGPLATFAGRAPGTMLNPVYLGAFLSGVLACWLVLRVTGVAASLVIMTLAIGLGLTGSRVGTVAVVLVAASMLTIAGTRGAAAQNLVVTMLGIGIAELMFGVTRPAASPLSRLGSHGLSTRVEVWSRGLSAVVERPMFGWGPGNIELAVESQLDRSQTAREIAASGTVTRWLDTHNVVINLAVGLGIMGLLAVTWFAVEAVRLVVRSRTPRLSWSLLVGVVVMAASWSLQPWTVHSIPIALLMLGAAGATARHTSRSGDTEERRARVAGVVGVTLALLLLLNLYVLQAVVDAGRDDLAIDLANYGYRDHLVDDYAARAFLLRSQGGENLLAGSAWHAERQAAYTGVHYAYELVGQIAFLDGRLEDALAAERGAARSQPWNPIQYERMQVLARLTDDDELLRIAETKLCQIRPGDCGKND